MVRDLPRDFEDHCWKDLIDADTIEIYQAYRRKTYVGDNPAVLAIDLYNKAYQGGNRPVREVDREFSGSCGENAWQVDAVIPRLVDAHLFLPCFKSAWRVVVRTNSVTQMLLPP